ncbi:hypothetical protein EJ08DRAFT_120736 [Tothia fuscella]|uniref:Uncharacterized protein n=1 Tax=Tothia fuscella TaxID=1048955 RepID=A0A9P4TSD3_9PEZI|nr:hypothetical protein EJ08DRAFT_120736 [Tothia fuscella]
MSLTCDVACAQFAQYATNLFGIFIYILGYFLFLFQWKGARIESRGFVTSKKLLPSVILHKLDVLKVFHSNSMRNWHPAQWQDQAEQRRRPNE